MASSDDRTLSLTELARELQRDPSSPLGGIFFAGLQQFYSSKAEYYRYPGLNPSDLEGMFFFRVWSGLKGWHGEKNPIEHWLSVVLKHAFKALVKDLMKRRQKEDPVDPVSTEAGERSGVSGADKKASACWNDDYWINDAARKALDVATALEYRIVTMRYRDGMTLKEVAHHEGITESRVDKIVRRFAAKARKALGDSVSRKKGGG